MLVRQLIDVFRDLVYKFVFPGRPTNVFLCLLWIQVGNTVINFCRFKEVPLLLYVSYSTIIVVIITFEIGHICKIRKRIFLVSSINLKSFCLFHFIHIF